MKKTFFYSFLILLISNFSYGQTIEKFADSIREVYKIPELNYAIISSEKIIEVKALGSKKINSDLKAELTDKFRIGSNTKTVSSYIATTLVKQGKIKWDTKFFDLYPELKTKSNPAYYDLTLQDFITFRANIIGWSYGNETPTKEEIKGNEQKQRYEFVSWILQQKPVEEKQEVYWSNPSYVAAGLMLEKVTGKDYKTLVAELGKSLDIKFEFGQPNYKDKNQTWGHNEELHPEESADNYKLNWLSSAGNINVSLPDYAKFIQLQLKGLLGKSNVLSADEFNYMHYGLPEFAFGWESFIDKNNGLKYSFHKGTPGTFLTDIYICKDTNKAFILFANVQSENADKGLNILFEELNKRYGK
ncbi:beta-lactamase family protein [Flavobacterium sp. LS1R49]|uniref:Beta-lactamase family protein n=1 Tax=Flavobacterium shii TaxID=2987687 RepID=A0A9X2ZA34_9FLAO|nr:serine hydrolase domain-containing protein [Flavobacterium shii]MCV9927196.1 beta-lactamase family protein [Flavobacterium shii]